MEALFQLSSSVCFWAQDLMIFELMIKVVYSFENKSSQLPLVKLQLTWILEPPLQKGYAMNLFTFDYIVIYSTFPYSTVYLFDFLYHFDCFRIHLLFCNILNLIQKLKPISFYYVSFSTFGGYLIAQSPLHEFD